MPKLNHGDYIQNNVFRQQLRLSNPKLDRIWIGFGWNEEGEKYLYADETEYENSTNWLMPSFYTQLMKRYPTPVGDDLPNCVSSSSTDNYGWTFTDCADPSFTAMCYVAPSMFRPQLADCIVLKRGHFLSQSHPEANEDICIRRDWLTTGAPPLVRAEMKCKCNRLQITVRKKANGRERKSIIISRVSAFTWTR